jgi:hypothetical protein
VLKLTSCGSHRYHGGYYRWGKLKYACIYNVGEFVDF